MKLKFKIQHQDLPKKGYKYSDKTKKMKTIKIMMVNGSTYLGIDDLLKSELKDYIDYSTTSLVTFILGAILLVLHFVFKNNKLPELSEIVKTLSFISFGIFGLYVVVSSIYYSKFYKSIGQTKKRINPILLILSLPFYPTKHFILKSRVKEDFHLTCLEQIK